jgi:hypothetical protein
MVVSGIADDEEDEFINMPSASQPPITSLWVSEGL